MTTSFDFSSDEFKADPFPVLARLCEEAPVHKHPAGHWTIARYADVSAGVRNHAQFSNAGVGYQTPSSASTGSFGPAIARRRLSSRDEPDHRKLRALMNPMFFPRAITNIGPKLDAIVEQLLGEMREKRRCGEAIEFVRDFAYPLTTLSINAILGVPDSIRDNYRSYSQSVDDSMADYFQELIRHKLKEPGDDLTTQLIACAKEGHDLLPMHEVHYYLGALWTGGTWTTTLHIANGAALLQKHPGVRSALKADASLVPRFVEEALRLDPPVLWTGKRTLSDVEIGGAVIPAGQTVLFLYAAANRDPRQFDHPDRFDLHREPNKHLAFSEGIHHCLGAPLSRAEAVAAFTRLASDDVGLELDLANAVRRAELNLSGYRFLPASIRA